MCITESLCYTAEIGTKCKSTILQFFKKIKIISVVDYMQAEAESKSTWV